jgi:hypothetical protein
MCYHQPPLVSGLLVFLQSYKGSDMCVFKAPRMPAPPPPPPAPPPTPQRQDPAVGAARAQTRHTAALAAGRDKTILTSGFGLATPAVSAKKRLLGV